MIGPALAVALLLALAGASAPQTPSQRRDDAASLVGKLLVASESMGDPRFLRTVIYMVHDDASGALGLIVNRPVAGVAAADLLKDLGRDTTGATGMIRVHYGGPVAPGKGFVLHTGEWRSRETHIVRGGIAVTAGPPILEAIAHGAGPRRSLFLLGYSGWGPGQLGAEMKAGAWITVPADEALVFDDDAASKWDRAMARRKITL